MTCFTKKFLATVIFVFSIFSILNGQSYDEVYVNGQKLWNASACKEACTEFKRYIYLQESQPAALVNNNKLAQCYGYLSEYYKDNGQLQKALNYLQIKQNIVCNEEDVLSELCIYSLMACNEHRDLRREVKVMCYKVLPEYSDAVHIAAYKALLVSLEENNLWDLFTEEYNMLNTEYPNAFTQTQKEVIDQALYKLKKFKPKNSVVAKCLSVIPGLGQTYGGDPADGLNAFAVNGTLIGLSVYSLCTGGYVDFLLLELKPVYRFYKGNFYNAGKDSEEYNSRKIKKMKAPVKEILLS